ncbi:phosphatase PAP2 family protein [Agrilutibacter solisilvae]|uniref:Phosphatase PAP2 family protein n=1 Tax=Agrilutibacter solisilvae TaxID=2763317 RepID=A0A975ASI7_9GAMM|nr:phosphatase PAP2 family protein [Lysobacter solisilvae]QSX78994.1 phosphatase PAP2 family protein [Lysobacter solisilvae]
MSCPPNARELAPPAIPLVRPTLAVARPYPGFHRRHALVLVGAAALAALWWAGQGDVGLADRLYALEGHRWALRDARLTQQVLHLLGRDLSTLAWLGVLAAWLVSCARGSLAAWRRPWLYLLSSSALAAASVAWIKSWSNMDCPWDLARYGGTHAYLGLFQTRPATWGHASCFPAGHASAGYMWLALYFFLARVRPRWRWRGLAVALVAGLLFGGAQQVRGAHFLSHDLATATVCWAVALGVHAAFWPPSTRRRETEASA